MCINAIQPSPNFLLIIQHLTGYSRSLRLVTLLDSLLFFSCVSTSFAQSVLSPNSAGGDHARRCAYVVKRGLFGLFYCFRFEAKCRSKPLSKPSPTRSVFWGRVASLSETGEGLTDRDSTHTRRLLFLASCQCPMFRMPWQTCLRCLC